MDATADNRDKSACKYIIYTYRRTKYWTLSEQVAVGAVSPQQIETLAATQQAKSKQVSVMNRRNTNEQAYAQASEHFVGAPRLCRNVIRCAQRPTSLVYEQADHAYKPGVSATLHRQQSSSGYLYISTRQVKSNSNMIYSGLD